MKTLFVRFAGAFNFAEGNIEKQEYNKEKGKNNKGSSIGLSKGIHTWLLSSNIKARNKQTIAATISKVKTTLPRILERSPKFGKMIIAPIQPADKLVNKPDRTLALEGENNCSIITTLPYLQSGYNLRRYLYLAQEAVQRQ